MEEEYIEKYLNGELNSEERREFDEKMENDADFRQSVELQRAIHKGFILERKDKFRSWMDSSETEVKKRPGKNRFMLPIYLVAASMALIVLLKVVFYSDSGMAYFEPYPNYVAPMERGSEEEDLFKRSMEAYENQTYDEALELLLQLEKSDTINFYTAQCYMASDNYPAAESLLIPISSDESSIFFQQSGWYLALIYLETHSEERALVYLQYLIDTKGYNYRKAEEIVKKISS